MDIKEVKRMAERAWSKYNIFPEQYPEWRPTLKDIALAKKMSLNGKYRPEHSFRISEFIPELATSNVLESLSDEDSTFRESKILWFIKHSVREILSDIEYHVQRECLGFIMDYTTKIQFKTASFPEKIEGLGPKVSKLIKAIDKYLVVFPEGPKTQTLLGIRALVKDQAIIKIVEKAVDASPLYKGTFEEIWKERFYLDVCATLDRFYKTSKRFHYKGGQ